MKCPYCGATDTRVTDTRLVDDGATVRFYLEGGQVCALQAEIEGVVTTMTITNASPEVTPDAFELPEGYTRNGMGEQLVTL